jgi:hypothetical protein
LQTNVIEDETAALDPDRRRELRQEKAVPIVREYREWLVEQQQTVLPSQLESGNDRASSLDGSTPSLLDRLSVLWLRRAPA